MLIIPDKTPLEVLRDVRALFTVPGTWIKGRMAEPRSGDREVEVHSGEAVKFCLLGAFNRVCRGVSSRERAYQPLFEVLNAKYGDMDVSFMSPDDLSHWNDDKKRIWVDVMEALDEAIKLEEQRSAV